MRYLLFIVFAIFLFRLRRPAAPQPTASQPTGFGFVLAGGSGSGGSSGGGGSQPLDYTMTFTNNVYRFDFNGVRFDVDLSFGGVLTWIGTATVNSVDDRDTGRYNGGSIYSNPEPLNVAGGVTTTYAGASWNPVQAGNDGGLTPTITSHVWNASTKTLTIVLRPLQWKYRNFIETDGTTLTVDYTIVPTRKALKARYTWNVNRAGENHTGRADETGFFYFKRNWDTVKSYSGSNPYTGAAIQTKALDLDLFYPNGTQHPNQRAIFAPSEKWVSLSNGSETVGVIMRSPNENVSDCDLNKVDTDGGYVLLQRNHTYHDTGVFTKTVERDLVIDTPANVRAYAYDLQNNTL